MTTPDATVAVDPSSIPDPTAAQLIGRVHAKLSEVESSVAAVGQRVEHWGEELVKRVVAELQKARPVIAAADQAAHTAASVFPPPISTAARAVAGVLDALCACGHAALHTAGGCTAPDCTCKAPAAK